MKHLRSRIAFWFASFAVTALFSAHAATLPADWQHEQPFSASSGLVKLSLPIETLDAARPALEDLRVYDDAGNELPYLIEHPAPAARISRSAKSFQTLLESQQTTVTIETGLTQPLDGVTLDTPANNFIKSVRIEGSADGRRWQPIAQGSPIFRQDNGASHLHLELSPGAWAWLRLTVDDQRSQPIPFTGATVQAASASSAPDETLPVTITERQESPGETRLTLNFSAANLTLSQIKIDTDEPLFTREITLAVPQVSEDSIREQPIGSGVIYRLTIEGRPATANLVVPIETQARSREMVMLIHNHDSPPLPITSVTAQRRPVYLVFLAKQTGAYHLLSGNSRCAAPQYDLAALAANLKTVAVAPIKFSALTENPSYRAPEVLPEVQDNGIALDTSAWAFRKPVKTTRAGAQQLELDLDALYHSQRNFEDLRLVHDGRQVPYIFDRTSISRAISTTVIATNDTKVPTLSRWIIKLPHAGLPVNRLVCEQSTAIFQRDFTLYEILADDRGEKYRHILNQATWTRTPDQGGKQFVLSFDPPQSDTLVLETQNGDNPPIDLQKFQLFCPVTRVLFKAKPADALLLYYGNPDATSPHYDLSLVANELFAEDKSPASLGAEEQLKKTAVRATAASGKNGVIFWGILALVVVVLLIVISRLLPKSETQPPK